MNKKDIKYNYSVSSIIFTVFLISFVFLMMGGMLSLIIDTKGTGSLTQLGVQGLSQILFLFIPTYIIAKRVFEPKVETLDLRGDLKFRYIFIGILALLVMKLMTVGIVTIQDYLLPEIFLEVYKSYEEILEITYLNLFGGNSLVEMFSAFIVGAIIPAVVEETLYRGFALNALTKFMNHKKAIIITSLIFGIMHFNPIHLIPLIVFGIFLGYLAYFSKNIIIPMLIHFLNNAISISFIQLGDLDKAVDNVEISISLSLILIIASIFGFLVLINILTRIEN